MFRRCLRCVLGVLLVFGPACASSERTVTPDLGRIGDAKTWRLVNAVAEAAVVDGRQAVVLRPKGEPGPGSLVGMALVEGQPFQEGAIDVDLRGGGAAAASFLGVAFAVADEKTFEAVYFRPFRFAGPDKSLRAHSVQYVSWPDHTWERLRSEKPGVYEAAIDPPPDPARWFHARVEVTKKTVRVFVDGARRPCLTVDRIGGRGDGKVGLWVDSQGAAFADLRISTAGSP